MQLLQNDTSRAIVFLMVDSTDHVTRKTGRTPVIALGKNGVFSAATGTVSEIDAVNLPGWYKFTPSAADVGVEGSLVFQATATGADPVDDEHEVVVLARWADALLARNQQGGSNTAPTVAAALAAGLFSFSIVGNTLTVKHGDGTVAFTRTLTRAVLDAIQTAA